MEILITLIAFLFNVVGGVIAVAIALLIILAVVVYTYKGARLLIALLNAAITEPENKIVAKVRKLNKAKR